ncbi:DNA repair ATPase [Roseibacillus ishigakijimensis]|uniref:DNA repair ATPase n=1 Tax=Roseibacillus ishigakijimensis TaxID=454146 RepID=A0A934VNC1_9BACT|nr:DNA repair ATPase [Roseibacillus ishigakijimensis]MBK1834875.1 DNA repair ATPase [Roseibacillus ishigakijimensis]
MSNTEQLEGGSYEVIRARLEKHGEDLRSRLGQLNESRKEIFGAIETALVATDRVTTEHNCVPRDLIAVGGNRFLFGYNIQFGLKQTTEISDVFAAYEYDPEGHHFHPLPIEEILSDSAFSDDFKYLYKYYKETVFNKFMVIGPHLYLKMRIGKSVDDFKTFKWLRPGDGHLEYLGNRFDHEFQYPPQQEFEWKRAHRDMQRAGLHPHVSINDRVFVETVGGDLTIKIEDNTESGEGIYAEPVEDADQSLDDAEIFYAEVGPLVLLKILPYREESHRYLVFNEKTREVKRIDAIGHSCVLLPDEQGLIFSNGYLLLTGEVKIFDTALSNMVFERRVVSANGEDTLFVFYNRVSGDYVLLSYNLISQTVDSPVICNGYSLFPNGELVYFKTEEAAQKHHSLQVWTTPYLSEEALARQQQDQSSYLFKVGNADLVRGMSECREVLTLLGKDDNYGGLYLDLVKRTNDLLDSYFWLDKEETARLSLPLREINGAAQSALAEFDKVRAQRQAASERTREVKEAVEALLGKVRHSAPDDIFGFVHHLSELRTRRGEVIGLREVRYAPEEVISDLESRLVEASEATSGKTVAFLLKEEALSPYREAVTEQGRRIPDLAKVTEADEVAEALDKAGSELELLIEIVGNLKIEDATQTTAIIDGISSIYAELNGVRADLKNKRTDLAKSEGVAQFSAQMKLISQAVVNYLEVCDTPEKCDESLTKLMIQLEELEGRFAEFDDYVEELAGKREEVYEAFEGRKQQLIDERNRRAGSLLRSAERILGGIERRLESFENLEEINGYFAGDLMVEKVRGVVADLQGLGDRVKADDLRTRLKTLREDAARQLKDRKELYVDGQNVIRLGQHAFGVNTRELELSIVPRDGEMWFHLAGTDFFEKIEDAAFTESKAVWNLEVASESPDLYRGEWLVSLLLDKEWEGESAADFLPGVQGFMQSRYAEGYVKGVHDEDAARILAALWPLAREAGLLRFSPLVRGAGMVLWTDRDQEGRAEIARLIAGHGRRVKVFADRGAGRHELELALADELAGQLARSRFAGRVTAAQVAEYLFAQLREGDGFVVSQGAADVIKHLRHELTAKRAGEDFDKALAELSRAESRHALALDWLRGVAGEEVATGILVEAAAHLARGGHEQREVRHLDLALTIEGLRGSHPRIEGGVLELHYNDFRERVANFRDEVLPLYHQFQTRKKELIAVKREEMKLEELKPEVMSAFVRNRLLDEVFLPVIGDNLAKQIGTAGADSRTDRMGLLLLISPPGYGKTTLMEYVANRLGLTFVKVNGPALGHHVTSLDPAQAGDRSAGEELEKLNLALEMGDNVMLYLDDIQHLNPEFLQKFISLCDAQRKIEGVYQGRAKTYDLKGKKVAVVMAGNPYTESGGKFQIPDMLANRADTYNLGDILGSHESAFKDSYIENCLTSNKSLASLAQGGLKDVRAVMKMAAGAELEEVDFESNYTPGEIEEFVRGMKLLYQVRDTILRVNLEYIASAAQEDAYRTEPAFKLQGSYRNMNRIAEKVVPLMTDGELQELVVSHYENEAQNLTTGAEANLLKFREMEGLLSEKEAARWAEIKKEFRKQKLLGGAGENDPVARVVAQLQEFREGLSSIEQGIMQAGSHYAKPQSLTEETVAQLREIISGLRAVPVQVDIKVVPVQDEDDSIESIEKSASPIDIQPSVEQGD